MKISLCLILKNEEEHLAKTLKTVSPFVDEIIACDTGSTDRTVEIAESSGAKVVHHKWNSDFSDARNASFSAATGDVVLWLDADDLFRGGENLRKIVESNFSNPKVGAIMLPYRYEFDDYGNCVSEFMRERLIRRGTGEWKGRLHETCILKEDAVVLQSSDCWVDHDTTPDRIAQSKVRNIKVLEKEIADTAPNVDPRTIFSFAKGLIGIGKNEEAAGWLMDFIEKSGWAEERYQALCILARVQASIAKPWDAIDSAMKALKLKPDYPDAYLTLGRIYCDLEQWDKSVHWTNMGLQQKVPDAGLLILNPRDYDLNAFVVLQRGYMEMGCYDEAKKAIEGSLKFLPGHPELVQRLDFLKSIKKDKDLAAAVDYVKDALLAEGGTDKLLHLGQAIPKRVEDYPFRRLPRTGPRSGKPRVLIYCIGNGHRPWGPKDVKSGIGGSEEAVIELSKRLAQRGWEVSVCADSSENGVVDNVRWMPFFLVDMQEEWDACVFWRDVELLDVPVKAKQKYLWLHDMPVHREAWTKERISKLNAAIFLSKFHREQFPWVPDDKVWISRNGIVPEHFTEQKADRVPFKCIYSSSQTRGLEYLLTVWPELKKVRPEAELHIYYGWEMYDAFNREKPDAMAWKQKILEMQKQPGVVDHGRVGHVEIARAFLSSSFWLYPCFTFDEISCITAMKAQTARCLPVVATRGALNETVHEGAGFKCDSKEEWLEAAKEALRNEWKMDSMFHVPDFSWDGVADEWVMKFNSGRLAQLELVK